MDIRKWTHDIDEVTAGFRNAFGSLDSAHLNFKRNATTWSIAQNIDHLMAINKTYFTIISEVRERKLKLPWVSKINFLVDLIGKAILNSVQPDNRRKMKTFPVWEPAQSNISGDIVERFARQQEELKKLIGGSKDLLKLKTVISSPANKNIVYKLETAFDIIVAHEKRHLIQATEILKGFEKNQA
jgi:hypothetical protein